MKRYFNEIRIVSNNEENTNLFDFTKDLDIKLEFVFSSYPLSIKAYSRVHGPIVNSIVEPEKLVSVPFSAIGILNTLKETDLRAGNIYIYKREPKDYTELRHRYTKIAKINHLELFKLIRQALFNDFGDVNNKDANRFQRDFADIYYNYCLSTDNISTEVNC